MMRVASGADHDFHCSALTALVTGFHSTAIVRSTCWRCIVKHIASTISLILGSLTLSYITVQAFVDRPPFSDPAVMAFYLILGSLWVVGGLILRQLEQHGVQVTDERC